MLKFTLCCLYCLPALIALAWVMLFIEGEASLGHDNFR